MLGNNDDDIDLRNEFKKHYSKKEYKAEKIPGEIITGDLKKSIESGNFENNTEIERLSGYQITIVLDDIIAKETSKTITNKEIQWNPSYKKDAKFQSDKFGEGTIISSKLTGIDSNSNQLFDVKVQFEDPHGIKTIKMIKKK